MKIYLAYRSGCLPNSRYIKEFHEDSILSWFQRHWEVFTKEESEEYIQVLGIEIYGYPIWQLEDEPLPSKPKNFEELVTIVEKYFYNNEVEGNEDCLRVLTDDDEIELAWFLFTENYKNKNWDKVSIWFNSEIPTKFGKTGQELIVENEIFPRWNYKGSTYFISCPIYDGANLENLEGVYKISGIRLPNLIEYLNTNNELHFFWDDIEYSYTLNEMKFIQYISKNLKYLNLESVLDIYSKIPLTELMGKNFEEINIEELLLEIGLRNAVEKPKVKLTEHFCEICITSGTFYNYMIMFDDLWVQENPELTKSILQFGATWRI